MALLAEADGAVVAATGLTSGTALADPIDPNAGAIRSLRQRRYRILQQSDDVGAAQTLLRRLASSQNNTTTTEEVSQ